MIALKYEISGGLKILTGFAKLQPNPEATRANVAPLIVVETESVDVRNKVAEIESITKLMLAARKASNQATNIKDAELKFNESIQYSEELKVKQEEMKPLKMAYLVKRKELAEANLVYFKPSGENEIAVDEAGYTLAKTAQDGLVLHEAVNLSDEGNVSIVPDFRGCKHWVLSAGRWESGMVAAAGEVVRPVGAIWDFDLNLTQSAQIKAQIEADRVGMLSVVDKADELTLKTDSLAGEAFEKEGKWKIQGVTTAFEDSQAWYNTELAKLTALYA